MTSPLLLTLGFALAEQLIAAAIFVPLQTEKFYDLCGALGFLSTTALSLYLTPFRPAVHQVVAGKPKLSAIGSRLSSLLVGAQAQYIPSTAPQKFSFGRHPRQIIASLTVILWATRLGSFLFIRIHKSGKDPRFDTIKKNPPKFIFAWAVQGIWIALTALPVYLINSIPSSVHPDLGIFDVIFLLVWAAGWSFEIIADSTKSQWRAEKEAGKHKEKFLTRGVWSWCRHPNYFGEITLWTGLALLSVTTLSTSSARAFNTSSTFQFLPLIAPLFEYALIRYLSGVPILEESMDKKFKGDKKYQKYKQIPCFVPFIGSKD